MDENSKLKPGEKMLCKKIVSDMQNNFCTQHVVPTFCEKKNFWQKFTCTSDLEKEMKALKKADYNHGQWSCSW